MVRNMLFLPGSSCVALLLQLCLVSSYPSMAGAQFSFEYCPQSQETTQESIMPCFGSLACHPTPTLSLCYLSCFSSFKVQLLAPPYSPRQVQCSILPPRSVLDYIYCLLLFSLYYTASPNPYLLNQMSLEIKLKMLSKYSFRFLPFSSYHKNQKYVPLMHSSSKYGSTSYGEQFRDENPRKWICDKDFQTVLPSFDLFSKFGKLYSKAGQIV
uniref:Uncharacterized protein n=1 Tax=Castor canadensis TaxID=51338 RepID=A0A8C0WGN8_CASCN